MQLDDKVESHPNFQGLFCQCSGRKESELAVQTAHLLIERFHWPKHREDRNE